MKRKVLSVMLASAMLATMFTGCGDSSTTDSNAAATTGNDAAATTTEAADTDAAKTDAAGGSVYYLNFKPEQDQAWQDLAATYTEQTGVPVTVITAADGTYEQTLKSEIAKTEAPTLIPGKRTGRTCKLEGLLSGSFKQRDLLPSDQR